MGMHQTRVAVIADIHGNRWALEAVLEDLDRMAVEHVVNLGDSLYGPLDPAGTGDMLLELGIPTIRGNQDRVILEPAPAPAGGTLEYVRESLREEHLAWVAKLEPTAIAFDDFFLCHGTPSNDAEYLLYEVQQGGVRLRSAADLEAVTREVRHSIVLCGHDHVPRTVRLPGGKLIIDPGSVGLPAFTDDTPYPHAMETGTPHARYSIVSHSDSGWTVEDRAIPYDWETASRLAEEQGRPDWAGWLASGRACAG
jgi:predicted phosphodiesterase